MNKTETGATGGQSAAHGYIQKADTAEKRWMGETSTYFLATGEQTAGAFCLVDETAGRGESVPLHRHSADMESFYVVSGEITIFVGEGLGTRVGAGSFAHIPGGTIHGFRIESETAPLSSDLTSSVHTPAAETTTRACTVT